MSESYQQESQSQSYQQRPVNLNEGRESFVTEGDDEESVTEIVSLDRADFDHLMVEHAATEAQLKLMTKDNKELLQAMRAWLDARRYWQRPFDVYALVTLGKAEAELERVCLQQELREAQAQ
jgi:hypothetical protein